MNDPKIAGLFPCPKKPCFTKTPFTTWRLTGGSAAQRDHKGFGSQGASLFGRARAHLGLIHVDLGRRRVEVACFVNVSNHEGCGP